MLVLVQQQYSSSSWTGATCERLLFVSYSVRSLHNPFFTFVGRVVL